MPQSRQVRRWGPATDVSKNAAVVEVVSGWADEEDTVYRGRFDGPKAVERTLRRWNARRVKRSRMQYSEADEACGARNPMSGCDTKQGRNARRGQTLEDLRKVEEGWRPVGAGQQPPRRVGPLEGRETSWEDATDSATGSGLLGGEGGGVQGGL
jgi:hypothetical protein